MKIFALDCAKKTAGVAISDNGLLIYESYISLQNTHSETLLNMCHNAFSASGLTTSDIDLYAVTAGPGSFTGIRIGVGLIKGFAFINNTLCAPVSSLKALAQSLPYSGVIAAVLNARREHVYGAVFLKNGSEIKRLSKDEILPAQEFEQKANELCNLHAKGNVVHCIGDGCSLITHSNFIKCDDSIINGRAFAICEIAAEMHKQQICVEPEKLLPIYLRLTLAERSLKQKESKK